MIEEERKRLQNKTVTNSPQRTYYKVRQSKTFDAQAQGNSPTRQSLYGARKFEKERDFPSIQERQNKTPNHYHLKKSFGSGPGS